MQETIFPPQMKCARHLDACLTPLKHLEWGGRRELEIGRDKRPNNEAHANANANTNPLPCRTCFWVLGSVRETQAVDWALGVSMETASTPTCQSRLRKRLRVHDWSGRGGRCWQASTGWKCFHLSLTRRRLNIIFKISLCFLFATVSFARGNF